MGDGLTPENTKITNGAISARVYGWVYITSFFIDAQQQKKEKIIR